MTTRLGLLILGLLFTSPSILAQNSCPAGFNYVGNLSLTGSYGAAEEKKEIVLPAGATIDTSYQQTSIRTRGGNRKAQSNLRAEDIPRGIHISPSGTTSLDKGWAVRRSSSALGFADRIASLQKNKAELATVRETST
jgi:hypothetical protein